MANPRKGWWRCLLCRDQRRHYTRLPGMVWRAHYARQHAGRGK